MLQFPFTSKSAQISNLIQQIEVLSQALLHTPIETQTRLHVFHQETLKSSLFSARIEGNQLTLANAHHLPNSSKEKNQLEVSNVIRTLQSLETFDTQFSIEVLQHMHAVVMSHLDTHAGVLRREPSAIYDQFGTLVYLTPSREDIEKMLATLVTEINRQKELDLSEQILLIVVSHYYFEKIHPFQDGNGRTGRVIIQYQLRRSGISGKYILPIDQYIDEHRRTYYDYLEKNTRHIEQFIEFFLQALIWSFETCLNDIKNYYNTRENQPLALLPRRMEIIAIIHDHPYISLQTLGRRFLTISRRTLAYDLQQLAKQGYIIKHGTTRGACYSEKI